MARMFGKRRSIIKDALMGAMAGGVATAVMGPAMRRLQKLERPSAKALEKSVGPAEPAVEKVARKVAEPLGIGLDSEERKNAGEAVHWTYGIFWGAVFGVLHDRVPIPPLLHGLLFGAALGVLSETAVLPALKLAAPANAYPVDTHLAGLASHLIYGATAERSYTLFKRVLS